MKRIILAIAIIMTISCTEHQRNTRYKSGALKYEYTYKNGTLNGIQRGYYESGALHLEVPHKNGKREGIGRIYYESGELNAEIPHKNGRVHGIQVQFYKNGVLQAEFPFKYDRKEGITKQYYESGVLKSNTLYHNGVFISRTYINIDGDKYHWVLLPNGMCKGTQIFPVKRKVYYGIANSEHCDG